ncbi:hypothetical protein ACHAXS_005593 [Conticribra weissflogii]
MNAGVIISFYQPTGLVNAITNKCTKHASLGPHRYYPAKSCSWRRFSEKYSTLPPDHPSNTPPKFPIPYYPGKTKDIPTVSAHPFPPSYATLNANQHEITQRKRQEAQHQLEIANALKPSYASQTPLHFPRLFSHSDAIYFWRSLDYWRVAVDQNIPVDVEIGKSYNSGKRVGMTFGEYLNYLEVCIGEEEREYRKIQNIIDGNSVIQTQQSSQYGRRHEIAYLAQNELFAQVQHDVPLPYFCHHSNDPGFKDLGEGKIYHTMIWMGPGNTISPLHYDPLDNLLIQTVGWKRVLLFPPNGYDNQPRGGDAIRQRDGGNRDVSEKIPFEGALWQYAGVDGNQYNTSAVDIEQPDFKKYPDFALAPTPYECLLGPGDAVFIPKKWWHHVRSLEFSVSVNAWWR